MVKQTIQIFARIKPTKVKTALFEINDDPVSSSILKFTIPRDLAGGFVNNKKESYKFQFKNVFDQSTKQDTIFDQVSQPVIDNVLAGYNGTIFAYGQTGSGKTFTITGGAEKYADRGIIPRTLSYIFQQTEKDRDNTYTVKISYLEIYNEDGYDLLDPRHEAAKLEELPKVHLMEDTDQNVHLKNLSMMPASNEEEALNLLFIGDTNRMIAETPMNQASTRSHCIFTIHLTCRQVGSATIRRSKLHLVDLAGSERVGKSGVNGLLLTEAKYINLSLHFLEQVIVALSEKNRTHIPYRNSMMTSVLRDSLGGNCMTSMIATCSVERNHVDESISTCRFAQRVALIKNDALLNEELDPQIVILQLRNQITQLKEDLQLKTGEERTDKLTNEEIDECSKVVNAFIDDKDPEAVLCVGADMRKIQACFNIFKKLLKERISELSQHSAQSSEIQGNNYPLFNPQDKDVSPYFSAEQEKLKNLLLQRDTEINILVNMLKKEKSKNSSILSGQEPQQNAWSQGDSTEPLTISRGSTGKSPDCRSAGEQRKSVRGIDAWVQQNNVNHKVAEKKTKKLILGPMSMGRQEAFEIFCQDYWNNDSIEEKKQTLKKSYSEAKHLGEQVNNSRMQINQIKSRIEQHRVQISLQGLRDSKTLETDSEEQNLREKIELEKKRYKENFNSLRNLKATIEHCQHLLEKDKVQLMKDFEIWWAEQMNLAQQQNQEKSARITDTRITQDQSKYPPTLSNNPPARTPFPTPSSSANSIHSHSIPLEKISPSLAQRSSLYGGLPLTGDAQVDADIEAFAKARQSLLQKNSGIK